VLGKVAVQVREILPRTGRAGLHYVLLLTSPEPASPRFSSHPFGRHRICNPNPGRPLNRPYDCQPFTNHGSIFKCAVRKICTRAPLKNHGVLEETYDGW
jgi:hypothetical protein